MKQIISISGYLAVKEVWRNRGRFLLVSLVIALITLLVLFIAALGEGLGNGNREYLSKLDAQLIVYQAKSDSLIAASRLGRDRLAAVGTLTSSIIHELGTPLTTVLGSVHMLLNAETDEQKREWLEQTRDAALMSQGVMTKLRALARRQLTLGPSRGSDGLVEVRAGLEAGAVVGLATLGSRPCPMPSRTTLPIAICNPFSRYLGGRRLHQPPRS